VVWNGSLWVGDDGGQLLRVDAELGTVASSIDLCAADPCVAADAVYATPYIDVGANVVLAASNGRLFQIDAGCSSASCATSAVAFGRSGVVWSSPTLDWQSGFVYAAFDNTLYKIAYPITADSAVIAQPMQYAGADSSYPRSSPLVWDGQAFVGDGGGYIERFAADATPSLGAPTTAPIHYGTSIDTTPLIDFEPSGNIYFGVNGTDADPGKGSVVQITRVF
jgi:hypothetical protein